MGEITSPVMLDSTGLTIANKLEALKNAVQPTNACMDIDISIPVSGWSGSTNCTYTYTNSHITSGCSVKVNFLEGAESVGTLYIQFEKVTNGVRFTAPTKPSAAIPVRIHILNADATSTTATTASAVSTNAVSGAANVQDALSSLSGQIANITPSTITIAASKQNAVSNSSNSIVGTIGGIYVISLELNVSDTIATGESPFLNIAPPPKKAVSGVVVRANDTLAVGGFYINSGGTMYINPTVQLSSGAKLQLNAIGIKV